MRAVLDPARATPLISRRVGVVVAAVGLGLMSLLIILELQIGHVVGNVGHLDLMLSSSDGAGGSLTSLAQLGEMRRSIAELSPQLRTINEQLASVRSNTASLEKFPSLQTALDGLGTQLDTLVRQFSGLAEEVAPISPLALDMRAMRGQIDDLNAQIRSMLGILKEMGEHIASLDRKTGPSVP